MRESPAGWEYPTIEEILQPQSDGRLIHQGWSPQCERRPTDDERDWGVLKTTAIQAGEFLPHEHKRLPDSLDPRDFIEVREGDLLLTCAGPRARCGVACFVRTTRPRLMLSGKMYRFRVDERHIDPRFIEAMLGSPDLQFEIDQIKTGGSDSGLNLTHERFRSLRVPLPPRAEQGRIVMVIEEAVSKLDAGEAGLRTARQLLKRMRETVLADAVTGRLLPQVQAETTATVLLADLGVVTHGSDDLPEGWARVRLGDIARVGSGTTPKRGDPSYWAGGTVPWVTSGLITKGVIRETLEFVTEHALDETSLHLWPPGTLLVAMYGEGQTRGRCAELLIEATCNQACAAIVLHPALRQYTSFVRLSFDANYSKNRRLASGGVQPNLSGGLIKDMVFVLPPASECERIVAEMERQFSFIEACEHAVEAGLARSAALRRSILTAAFDGRLVPQDPNDEPACVLLDRIRAERSSTPPPKRRARQTA